MLGTVMRDVRSGEGIEDIADLGTVHCGPLGSQLCEVSLRIERRQDLYHLCIGTALSDGPAFRRTRVVKWPYSRRDRRDLTGALVDFHVVKAGPRPGVFVDDRTSAGKLLDSLTRRVVHGAYRFRSPMEAGPGIVIHAEIVDVCGHRTVTLAESTPRKGRVEAHLPHAAFAGLCAGIERYVAIV